MITGADFLKTLQAEGFDFFTGVPCSLLKSLIACLEEEGRYIPETREDAAVGLAAGAYMAGKQPVVMMQNSALGVCLNALASLSLIYELPCLLIVTWRGYQGQDAPEHLIMGTISPRLFETMRIPYRVLGAETATQDAGWAAQALHHSKKPVALLLPPGVLA